MRRKSKRSRIEAKSERIEARPERIEASPENQEMGEVMRGSARTPHREMGRTRTRSGIDVSFTSSINLERII